MPDDELSAGLRYEIAEVSTVTHEGQQLAVFCENSLPVGAVHFGVIKKVALCAPRLVKDFRPLDGRIDLHLQLSDIERAVSNLCRFFRRDNAPRCGGSAAG